MNVFRSFARSLWSALDFRQRPSADKAPATSRLRDGFDRAYRAALRQPTHVDAFDPGARTTPVDLTGGVKPTHLPIEEPRPAPVLAPSTFVASLDDLGLLAEPPAEAPAESASSPGAAIDGQLTPGDFAPVVEPFELARPSAPMASDTPAAAPLALAGLPGVPEPPAEGLLELSDFAPVVDGFEPAAPLEQAGVAAASEPRADQRLSLEAFGPVVDSFEPAPATAPRVPAQHTVELLMPAAPSAPPMRPQAAEQFSTVALLDLVSQLNPGDAPATPDEAGAAQAPANPTEEPRAGQEAPPVDSAQPDVEPGTRS